jgi:hypothetical protein
MMAATQLGPNVHAAKAIDSLPQISSFASRTDQLDGDRVACSWCVGYGAMVGLPRMTPINTNRTVGIRDNSWRTNQCTPDPEVRKYELVTRPPDSGDLGR